MEWLYGLRSFEITCNAGYEITLFVSDVMRYSKVLLCMVSDDVMSEHAQSDVHWVESANVLECVDHPFRLQ